ncbi:MAG: hypothetical protein M0C28_41345 [Candidatus Moduliflexus flocculans]|nr:hypothetical protein [Candidatus Moduliflexus flocculans]
MTMYSNILMDECAEDDPVRADLQLIVEQAERCKKDRERTAEFCPQKPGEP